MEPKKYSSYAQIDHDLDILRIEREIQYQKIRLSVEKTKESLMPSHSVSLATKVYKTFFKGTAGAIIKALIPMLINWYINKKRGD